MSEKPKRRWLVYPHSPLKDRATVEPLDMRLRRVSPRGNLRL